MYGTVMIGRWNTTIDEIRPLTRQWAESIGRDAGFVDEQVLVADDGRIAGASGSPTRGLHGFERQPRQAEWWESTMAPLLDGEAGVDRRDLARDLVSDRLAAPRIRPEGQQSLHESADPALAVDQVDLQDPVVEATESIDAAHGARVAFADVALPAVATFSWGTPHEMPAMGPPNS